MPYPIEVRVDGEDFGSHKAVEFQSGGVAISVTERSGGGVLLTFDGSPDDFTIDGSAYGGTATTLTEALAEIATAAGIS